jgi:hypothetical protein
MGDGGPSSGSSPESAKIHEGKRKKNNAQPDEAVCNRKHDGVLIVEY